METMEKVKEASAAFVDLLNRVPAGDVDAVLAAFVPKLEGAVDFLEAKAKLEKKGA